MNFKVSHVIFPYSFMLPLILVLTLLTGVEIAIGFAWTTNTVLKTEITCRANDKIEYNSSHIYQYLDCDGLKDGFYTIQRPLIISLAKKPRQINCTQYEDTNELTCKMD
jgi:hypothetical protein